MIQLTLEELIVLSKAFGSQTRSNLIYSILDMYPHCKHEERTIGVIVDDLVKRGFLSKYLEKYSLTKKGLNGIRTDYNSFENILNSIRSIMYNNL